MKILLIGGSGYIGSRLTQELQTESTLISCDLEWFGHPLGTPNQVLDYGDLPARYLNGFDVILLFAGHSSVRLCDIEAESSLQNNVNNFVQLLEKLTPSQKFIYASSSSVYGNLGTDQYKEDCTSFLPNNYYDLTKYFIDNYSQLYGDIQYYGLRLGTVNGDSANFRTDLMINAMVKTAREKGELELFYPQIHRPILGMRDLVRAIKAIISVPKDLRGIYNLSSFSLSAEEISLRVGSLLNVPVKKIFPPDRFLTSNPKKPYDFQISSEKFQRNFDFTFSETIESIVEEILSGKNYLKGKDRLHPRSYKKTPHPTYHGIF